MNDDVPYRIIEGNVRIGEGTKVWEFTKIYGDVEIGKDCLVSSYCELKANQGKLVIGDRVRIQQGCLIDSPTTIGDGTFIAVKVIIGNDRYPPSKRHGGAQIGKNVVIGNGVNIVPGTIIGDNAVIGAGSVVTKDVPANAVMAGVPARQVSTRDVYDKKKAEWEAGI